MTTLCWGAAAFACSGLIGIPLRRLLRRMKVVDRPNERSSHARPTVRGGGTGVVLVILGLGSLACHQGGDPRWIGFMLALGLLAAVSFLDDCRTLPWWARFAAHAAAAAGFLMQLRTAAGAGPLLGLVLFLFLTGYANAFNFMDGINGLAASQAMLTGFGTVLLARSAGVPAAHPALAAAGIIGGAAAGFLPHNFPAARMFLGDVGSVSLGFALAATSVWIAADRGWWLLMPLGLLHANFILDTGITALRRFRRGEPLTQAHREHFYQRLVRSGDSHSRVMLGEFVLQMAAGTMLILAVPRGRLFLAAAGAAVLALWLVFFAICERRFRRDQGASSLRNPASGHLSSPR